MKKKIGNKNWDFQNSALLIVPECIKNFVGTVKAFVQCIQKNINQNQNHIETKLRHFVVTKNVAGQQEMKPYLTKQQLQQCVDICTHLKNKH